MCTFTGGIWISLKLKLLCMGIPGHLLISQLQEEGIYLVDNVICNRVAAAIPPSLPTHPSFNGTGVWGSLLAELFMLCFCPCPPSALSKLLHLSLSHSIFSFLNFIFFTSFLTKASTKLLQAFRFFFFFLYFMRTWLLFFFLILFGSQQNFVLCRLPKLGSLGSGTRQEDVYSWW